MRSDELQRRIGPPSALSHIIVIEQRDLADSFQALLPFLHPGMGRRRASSGRKEKTRFHRWKLGFLPDSANRLPAAPACFANLFRQERVPADRDRLEAYLPLASTA